jgi:hypothetical protein
MGKRTRAVDVLKEIRRALRALRRAEAHIVATERRARREGEELVVRAELKRLAEEARHA